MMPWVCIAQIGWGRSLVSMGFDTYEEALECLKRRLGNGAEFGIVAYVRAGITEEGTIKEIPKEITLI